MTDQLNDKKAPRPLLWEEKAAIGCLGLLSLQSVHEFLLQGIGSPQLRGAYLGPVSLMLLVFVLAAGWGLLIRTRKGWWGCLLLTALLGLAYLGVYWKVLQTSWEVRFSNRYGTGPVVASRTRTRYP